MDDAGTERTNGHPWKGVAVLASTLRDWGTEGFAVLDGAQFENLPDALLSTDLRARGLYRDRGDNTSVDYERTMPQLLPLSGSETARTFGNGRSSDTIDRILELIGTRPAAVFWRCPAGQEALYRHLRRINRVLYPSEERELSGDEGEATSEAVTFRHSDANVLAQVLPAFDTGTRSRLFGPATMIAFRPEAVWCDAPEHVEESAGEGGTVLSARGGLEIDVQTVKRIEAVHRIGAITAYLRDTNPTLTRPIPVHRLRRKVREWTADGLSRSMQKERTLWKWNYLNLISDGAIAQREDVREFLQGRYARWTVEEGVDALMEGAIEDLREADL